MSSLVSVVIVAYNSSPFIVETLDSVLKQTWVEIELIITDDCSTDDTVEICRNWIDKFGRRFFRIELITSENNTGISANANRGLYVTKGDWIKFLGADDILKPDCIKDNMEFIASNHDVKVLFSRIEVYSDSFKSKNLIETIPGIPYNPKGILAPQRCADSQYKMLLTSDRIHFTPSAFLFRDTIIAIQGFDERFKFLEDYPLWLTLTKNGIRLHFMDKTTVGYRRHSGAVNNSGRDYLVNPNYFKSEQFRRIYTYPYLPATIRISQRYEWYALQIFRCNRLNRNKQPFRILLDLLKVYLNPIRYFIYLKKCFIIDLKNNEFYM